MEKFIIFVPFVNFIAVYRRIVIALYMNKQHELVHGYNINFMIHFERCRIRFKRFNCWQMIVGTSKTLFSHATK